MLRHLLLAVALALVPSVAMAQPTIDVLTVGAKLVDNSPGDGKIILSSKRGPFAAKTAINNEPCPVTVLTPAHSYTRFGESCPTPDVTVPTPPPVVETTTKMLPNGEVAIQRGALNIAFGRDASLGTSYNVPAPFLTDKKNGIYRLSFFTGEGDDLLLQGRSQDIANLIVTTAAGSRTYSAGLLNGYRQIRGSFGDPFTFNGETVDTLVSSSNPPSDGIKVVQIVTVEATHLSYRVRVTNARSEPVTVTYFRAEDPDAAKDFATLNRVLAPGRWDAGIATGQTYFIETSAPGAFTATQVYNKATSIGTRREVGYSAKADYTLQLVWPAVLLAPGESTLYEFSQGLR